MIITRQIRHYFADCLSSETVPRLPHTIAELIATCNDKRAGFVIKVLLPLPYRKTGRFVSTSRGLSTMIGAKSNLSGFRWVL